ncbi:MAG: mannose-1-phosphate guanylyltransferase [Chloroflexi bacterium]|nr:mannose-1-phosphate guanylyltransferase [Chloroflexota bacterium]
MLEHYYAVIMAGGGGTRLWPLSRRARPKQMLRLIDHRSLFQTSVERLEGVFPLERIFIVTVKEQALELKKQCPKIPVDNFIIEPSPRGTASVVGLAAVALKKRDPQAVMAVLTSDHYIGNEAAFRQLLEAAHDVALDDYLVTIGIQPTYPATGYGYIQRGEGIGFYRGVEACRVLRFKEKPDEIHAKEMLSAGDHTWNSGMFFWRVDTILREFKQQMPALASTLDEIASVWNTRKYSQIIQQLWQGLKQETIDYGIMEGANHVAVIPASGLEWSDVGTWDSLFDVLPSDNNGNIVMGGRHLAIDTRKSLVYVNQEHRLIVTIGVEDLVLVDTGDVLLVCRKDQAQKVRNVVDELKKTNGTTYV